MNILYRAGAWGFVIVMSSMFFAYIGLLIDQAYSCEPMFMIGLLFLAIILCMIRIFDDIKKGG